MGIHRIMPALPVLLLASLALEVSGHGAMVWPPIWQDGHYTSLNKITGYKIYSDPKVKDPNTGLSIADARAWLTDQAYIGGHGDNFKKTGEQTNFKDCGSTCSSLKHPWAAPGRAPNLGGGCGIFWGNPMVVQLTMTSALQVPTVATLRGALTRAAPGLTGQAPSRSTSLRPRTQSGPGALTNGWVGLQKAATGEVTPTACASCLRRASPASPRSALQRTCLSLRSRRPGGSVQETNMSTMPGKRFQKQTW